jgi:hypothetical protein
MLVPTSPDLTFVPERSYKMGIANIDFLPRSQDSDAISTETGFLQFSVNTVRAMPRYRRPRTHATSMIPSNTERTRRAAEFARNNPDLMAYCERYKNDFTVNCLRVLNRDGEMTGPQIAAIRRSLERYAAQDGQRAERVTTAAPAGAGLDLSHVPGGRYAVPNGDTRLKVLFQKPEPPSKWAGWVFVSDAAEYGQRRKYGRQPPGKTYSGMIQDELRIIAADPRAAAVAYGRLTGVCRLCGRKLENEASVAAGIGPICAEKQGW